MNNLTKMNDELTYKLFKAIEETPATNQRRLAASLEMSLGKLNYCLKALFDKGLVKAENFIESNNKRSYLYKITPAGIEEKVSVTLRFLLCKEREFEIVQQQISQLKNELKKLAE